MILFYSCVTDAIEAKSDWQLPYNVVFTSISWFNIRYYVPSVPEENGEIRQDLHKDNAVSCFVVQLGIYAMFVCMCVCVCVYLNVIHAAVS